MVGKNSEGSGFAFFVNKRLFENEIDKNWPNTKNQNKSHWNTSICVPEIKLMTVNV